MESVTVNKVLVTIQLATPNKVNNKIIIADVQYSNSQKH